MRIAQRGECLRRARDARFALIFRGCNAGYCRSLYFQRLLHVGRRELRGGKRENGELHVHMYVISCAASATPCVHVRKMPYVQS